MKKLYTIVMVFISALCLVSLANSCSDESKLIEELDLANVLTPTSTSAVMSNVDGCTTTFSWSSSSTATQYCLEIYRWEEGSQPTSAEITETFIDGLSAWNTFTVEQGSGNTTSFDYYLDPDLIYYARVKGQNPGYQGDSHWAAFRYPLEPALIMELVEKFGITERTMESLTISWKIAEDDEDGINQVRIYPNPETPDDSDSYKSFTDFANSEEEDYDYECKIEGLTASTQYKVSVNFGGTSRGTVVAFTMPNVEGATTVKDTTELFAAIADGAPMIALEYSEEPYEIGEYSVPASSAETLELYGLGTASGDMPTVKGFLSFSADHNIKNIHLEGLAFDGNNYEYTHILSLGAGEFNDISVLNCTLDKYKRGLIYAGSNAVTINGELSFNSVYVTDTQGDGGEAVGFRGAGSIGSFSITNSTFDGGMREFMRIDDTNTIGSFTFEHNTVNSITTASNSYGIFYIRAEITGDCSVSYNIFMNLKESTVHGVSGRYVIGASAFSPTKSTGNYWYNIGNYADEKEDNFFSSGYTLSSATSGGGVLSNDPCYDSSRSNFYVTNSTVADKGSGDPRWYGDYVPEPEQQLEVVEEEYEWDLTDSEVFYGTLDQSTTKGNLRFLINGTTINFTDDGFLFTGKSSLITTTGIPTDCAIAFLVNQPGSVVLSTSGSGNTNLTVSSAYYDADPDYLSTYKTSVAGSVTSNVDNEYVATLDIPESGEDTYVVYVYATDAITMTGLKWLPMTIKTGVAPLPTPTNLKVSPEEADESVSSVTVTWDAVANATYTLYLDGNEVASGLEDTTYELSISGIEADSAEHEIAVQANYAGSLGRDDSDISDPVIFVKKSSWAAVPSTETTTWGDAVWQDINSLHGQIGSSETWLYTDNMLFFDATSKTFTFASDSYGYYTKISGSGKAEQDNIQFKVKTNGTFTFSTGSGGDSREANVYVDGAQWLTGTSADGTSETGGSFTSPNGGYETWTLDITGISGETVIAITSKSSGINFYELSWTPIEGAAPDGCVPNDKVTEWDSTEFETLAGIYGTSDITEAFYSTDGLLYFLPGDSGKMKLGTGALSEEVPAAYRFQFGGSGSTTKQCVQFHVSTDGTLSFKIGSSSSESGNADRYLNVTVGNTETKGSEQSPQWAAKNTADSPYPNEYSFNVTGISGDTTIYLYSAGSAMNCFDIKWIPDGVTE